MTRGGFPVLILIAVAMTVVSTALGSAWMWIIVALLVMALVSLVLAMWMKGMFFSPKVLVDDIKDRIQSSAEVSPPTDNPDIIILDERRHDA